MRRWLPVIACLALDCARTLPPYGQARVTVATDGPVPQIVSRLRLDVYEDGAWIDSRDTPLRSPADWPASFTVYTSSGARRLSMRLRAYREGALRDYRGERYSAPPPPGTPPDAEPAPILATGQPRLLRDGADVTPLSEPEPESAIDRLVVLDLREGEVQSVDLQLVIACAGTMADLRTGRTCVDERGVLVDATSTARGASSWSSRLASDRAKLPAPRAASFASDGTPLFADQVQLAGGPMILGSRAESAQGGDNALTTHSFPERVFVVPPLNVDRHEVTVGRYRAALARGFVTDDPPTENPNPTLVGEDDRSCTFSSKPLGRETLPLTCVTHATARAFCRFEGGDLPTEAEWEWLATAQGSTYKRTFPWGDAIAGCEDVVYGRAMLFGLPEPCATLPHGPQPVDRAGLDVTNGGVLQLAGNVTEFVADGYLPFASACWASAPLYAPSCDKELPVRRSTRGGSWAGDAVPPAALRNAITSLLAVDVGFRCVQRP